jgi:hypothetical protein
MREKPKKPLSANSNSYKNIKNTKRENPKNNLSNKTIAGKNTQTQNKPFLTTKTTK